MEEVFAHNLGGDILQPVDDLALLLGGSSQDLDTWFITMVIVSPLRIGLWDPFQMAFSWLINGGDPKHSPAGMILQVGVSSIATQIANESETDRLARSCWTCRHIGYLLKNNKFTRLPQTYLYN